MRCNHLRCRIESTETTFCWDTPPKTQHAGLYLVGKKPTAPLVSPVHADRQVLPPLLSQVPTIETRLDEVLGEQG